MVDRIADDFDAIHDAVQGLRTPREPLSPWDTALPDWEERIMAGQSLVPDRLLNAARSLSGEAQKALRIFKRLRLPDVPGCPTLGEACGEWYYPIVEVLFGSLDPTTNRRNIQEVFELISKKNSKSSNGGAVMVVAMIVNRRPMAEFLLIAPTKEIADIAFKQAEGMCRIDQELNKLFHAQRHIKTLTHRRTGATLQIKAADTDVITGSKATGTMIDETHVFAKRSRAADVFVEIRGALASRPDGFLFQTTTQSKDPPSGVFAAELATARAVRDGKMKLPLLPILYELPAAVVRDGGWKERRYWPLVNPNLGRSVDPEFLERELVRAEQDGASALTLFASQHFNVQIGMALRSDGWAGAQYWERGIEPGLDLEAILERSDVCTVGIDGGGLDDLLGVAVLGREKETRHWLGWAHAFVSPEGLERRKANLSEYQMFEADRDLTIVDQLPDDLDQLLEIVIRVRDADKLGKVGADRLGLPGIVEALASIDVKPENDLAEAIRQGIGLMGTIKAIERKLVDGTFKHGGSRMLSWCAGNARLVATPTAMRIARDESGYGKVDPLMALFNSADCMSRDPKPKRRREYQVMFVGQRPAPQRSLWRG